MNQRMIMITTMAILVIGCASKPADEVCRGGIKRLDHASKDRELYTPGERARFEAILRTARRWESIKDYERCKNLVRQTKPQVPYCELPGGRRVKCDVVPSLRVPPPREG